MTSLKSMKSVNEALNNLGYGFKDGALRKLNDQGVITDKPFNFNISDNHEECQVHYEKVGDVVTQYVYNMLESDLKMIRLPVPKNSEIGTFVFTSEGYDEKETLLILIHGSGVVRAGQWARSIIINDDMNKGSQIPYIKKAIEKNYGILVMNTNDNYDTEGKEILESSTSEEHACYVWENYISKTKADSLLIVAHSFGGVITTKLFEKYWEDCKKRVKAVAFTDSVHRRLNTKSFLHLKTISKNWCSSTDPLDTSVKTSDNDVPRVSAGHPRHEMTSHAAIESVFKFFEETLRL